MSALKLPAKRLRRLYKEGKRISDREVQHASDDLFLSIYRDSPPGNCLICWFCYPDFRPERKSSHCCDCTKMPVQVADGIPEWCPLRKDRKTHMKYKWLIMQFAFYKRVAKRLNQYASICVSRLTHINNELEKIIVFKEENEHAES